MSKQSKQHPQKPSSHVPWYWSPLREKANQLDPSWQVSRQAGPLSYLLLYPFITHLPMQSLPSLEISNLEIKMPKMEEAHSLLRLWLPWITPRRACPINHRKRPQCTLISSQDLPHTVANNQQEATASTFLVLAWRRARPAWLSESSTILLASWYPSAS